MSAPLNGVRALVGKLHEEDDKGGTLLPVDTV